MSEYDTVEVERADSIGRGAATRPWRMNEVTINEIASIHGMHRRLDSVYVPWAAQDPIDRVVALFTIDERILDRRGRELGDLVGEVASIVETDPRLEQYVLWEHIEPRAVAASIDDSHTRIKIEWAKRAAEVED